MRRLLYLAAAGFWLGTAHASDLEGRDPRTGQTPQPARPPAAKPEPVGCGSHGTALEFVDSPAEAARKALKEEKLVFVLHVSGNFEDPRFT